MARLVLVGWLVVVSCLQVPILDTKEKKDDDNDNGTKKGEKILWMWYNVQCIVMYL